EMRLHAPPILAGRSGLAADPIVDERERAVELARVRRAGLRQVRPAAAAPACRLRDLLDEPAGGEALDEVLGDGGHQVDLAVEHAPTAAAPATASMRRTPEATAPSSATLKNPIWPVASRCVPPQSSVENSPIFTTRTRSPYFSPKSAMAPAASASFRSISRWVTGVLACTCSLTSSSTCSISRSLTAPPWEKSKRRWSGATSEPACDTCVPRTFRSAACNRCVPVWCWRSPWRRGESIEA